MVWWSAFKLVWGGVGRDGVIVGYLIGSVCGAW